MPGKRHGLSNRATRGARRGGASHVGRRGLRSKNKAHKGWQFGGHKQDKKGRNWNAREDNIAHAGRKTDAYGNTGDAQEKLFGPGDRPADTQALAASAPQRGDTPQGTTAATQRPGIENWYHQSSKYSNPGLTRDTSTQEWQHTRTRNT